MDEIEKGLFRFGGRKVIWLDGDACEPVTSGHVDGYVAFARVGAILVEGVDLDSAPSDVWATDIERLRSATDAGGRSLEIVVILPPRGKFWKFSNRSFAPLCVPKTLSGFLT